MSEEGYHLHQLKKRHRCLYPNQYMQKMKKAIGFQTIYKSPHGKSRQHPSNERILKDNEQFVGKLRLEGSCTQQFSWATTSRGICLNTKRVPATYLPNYPLHACSILHSQIDEVLVKGA